ncbi:MAG: hypothetical protein ACI85O_003873 [Saprospiraceae bacterium]|jgi:hypothetical protein
MGITILNLSENSELNYFAPVKHTLANTEEAFDLLKPETDLERAFMNDKDFKTGLFWGKPRFGHPEGEVVYHIREVLDNVEKLDIDAGMRRRLRIITFVHDTFKHLEDRSIPRDWSRHHATLASNFLAKHTDKKILLDVTALHDEAYYAWRAIHLYDKEESGKKRMSDLIKTVGKDLQLYYLFFKCDTQTGDKVQAPVRWFEETVKDIEVVKF